MTMIIHADNCVLGSFCTFWTIEIYMEITELNSGEIYM